MKLPLELIADWFNSLPETVRGNLAFFCVIRLMPYDPLRQESPELYREWLGAKLDYFQHVGRTVSACALIDYIMEEQGDPHHWDESLELQLDMMESDLTPDAKQTVNAMLPNHPQIRADWLEAAARWRQLRSSMLGYDAIHAWEREIQQQFPPRQL